MFLQISQNSQEHLFYRTPLDDCFYKKDSYFLLVQSFESMEYHRQLWDINVCLVIPPDSIESSASVLGWDAQVLPSDIVCFAFFWILHSKEFLVFKKHRHVNLINIAFAVINYMIQHLIHLQM